MKRSALIAGAVVALGLSTSALAQLAWVEGTGDSSGHWQSAEYRVVDGRLARVQPADTATARAARPALSYGQLAAQSETDSPVFDPNQPRYRVDDGKLVLQNRPDVVPRERVTLTNVKRLYRDFATG